MGSFCGTIFKKLCVIFVYILGLSHLLLPVLLLICFIALFYFGDKKRLLVSVAFGGEMGPLDEFISN